MVTMEQRAIKDSFLSFESKWRPLAKTLIANKNMEFDMDRNFFEMPYTHQPLTDKEILDILDCPLIENVIVERDKVTMTVVNF